MQQQGTLIVTGGTGYIGSHMAAELLRKTDFNVVSIDNYLNSSPATVGRVERLTGKRFVNHAVDLRDAKATQQVFAQYGNIAGVIHFAALKSVPDSTRNPHLYYDNNIVSLLNLLGCCEQFGVRDFIFSSSCTVYGAVTQLPVNEDTPIAEAMSPYGLTKLTGERILQDYVKYKPMNVVSLRYFNPVGADETGLIGEDPINKFGNVTPIIVSAAVGEIKDFTVYGLDYDTRDGSCIRDYVHVTDIVDAHLLALNYLLQKRNKGPYEIFNLGTGNGVSVLELLAAFERASGIKLPYIKGPRRAGDLPAIYSDCRKAERILDWKPHYTIDDMMRTAWLWKQNLIAEGKAAHASAS
jgi:UDP-glucose 4-epimerase